MRSIVDFCDESQHVDPAMKEAMVYMKEYLN